MQLIRGSYTVLRSIPAITFSVILFTISSFVWGQQPAANGAYVIETVSEDISPKAIAIGPSGEIYVASFDNRIYRSDDGKTFRVIAGLAHPPEFCCVDPAPPRPVSFSGDGGPALQAYLDGPSGIVVGDDGTIYFVDFYNNRVRRISTNGIIETIAGTGEKGYSGDGGPARNAMLHYPESLAIDKRGNLFIGDMDNNRIRMVDRSGTITTVAGNGKDGYTGDGHDARKAQLRPNGVFVDDWGTIFIADAKNGRIRKVDAFGIIHTIAGTGKWGYTGDGGPAAKSQVQFVLSIVTDHAGNVFFTDSPNGIRRISTDGIITTIGANGKMEHLPISQTLGNGQPATDVSLFSSTIAISANGKLYVNDRSRLRVLIPVKK